jgi:hypothetical protein
MAKSAVEFLHSEYKRILGDVLVDVQKIFAISDSFEKSKEMQEIQKDEFAIRFLDSIREYERESGKRICFDERDSKELLEIYKK